MNYKKLYLRLFNAVTDAIAKLREKNYGEAEKLLKQAQILAEETYMQESNSSEA